MTVARKSAPQTGVPGDPGGAIAASFVARRWRAERPEAEAVIEVRVDARAADTITLLAPALGEAVTACAAALGLAASEPRVVGDATLPAGEFEVRVEGVVRYAGSLSADPAPPWTASPVGGPSGRTGVAARVESDGGPEQARVVRAVEEVVWRDPSALASDEELARLLDDTPLGWSATDRDQLLAVWRPTLRGLAAARVPLAREPGDANLLRTALDAVDANEREHVPCELLAYRLRPYEIAVVLGGELYDAVWPDAATSRLEQVLLPTLRTSLFRELGTAFPRIRAERADAGTSTYTVVVNALVRVSGELSPGKVAVHAPPDALDGVAATPWIDPLSGRLGSLVDLAEAPRLGDRQPLLVEDVLARQLTACLREAAAEFTDLPWTQQQLDLLRNDYPEVVRGVVETYSYALLARTFSALVDEGLSIRDLPPLLERLLERSMTSGRGDDLAVDLRRHRRAWLCQRFAQHIDWEPGPGIRPVRRTLTTVRLGPRLEAALRVELAGEPPSAGVPSVRSALLRGMRPALPVERFTPAAEPLVDGPVLVVPPDLRAAVRRALAAQFPLVTVLADDEIAGQVEERTVRVLDADSAT